MAVLIAISVGATLVMTQITPLQSLGYTQPSTTTGTFMTGHVTAVVYDEEGIIKAYRQADNAIVITGLETLADQLFMPWTFNGQADTGLAPGNNHTNQTGGRFGWMNIGNGSAAVTPTDDGLNCPLISAGTQGCAPDGALASFDRGACIGEASEIWNTVAEERLGGPPTNVAQINVTAVATFDGADCFSNAIREAALWNNATTVAIGPAGGQVFARNTFGSVTLTATDSLELTWRFTFTDQ